MGTGYKSVTVDFEHKRITYRPYDAPEVTISVNAIYPDLFKAEHGRIEIPTGEVEEKLKLQETAGIPVDIVRSQRNIDTTRSNIKTVIAKKTAYDAAVDIVDQKFKKFDSILTGI